MGYLKSPANFLDAVIVIVSMVDSWVLSPLGSNAMGNVAVLRLVRLLRLAKVLRVVRVMKAFASLRVLVAAVANSVGALGWSMALLFVLELIGAIFMSQVLKPYLDDPLTNSELREFVFKRFGTWTNSMFTIFEVTMSPGGFVQYRRLYEEVHPLFGMFFVVYVCLVTFAVVRVITAMFLKATLAASSADENANLEEKQQEQTEYIFGLKTDVIGDAPAAYMQEENLANMLSIVHFREWMIEHGIGELEVRRIYRTLDRGNGKVVFDEFAISLIQMITMPRFADKVINFYETRRISARLRRLERFLRQGKHVDALRHPTNVSPACPTVYRSSSPAVRTDPHLSHHPSSDSQAAIAASM